MDSETLQIHHVHTIGEYFVSFSEFRFSCKVDGLCFVFISFCLFDEGVRIRDKKKLYDD